MKGKISYLNDGGSCHLQIFRGSKFKTQYCPYYTDSGQSSTCGDWCPLFGEPEINDFTVDTLDLESGKKSSSYHFVAKLEICNNRTLVFDEFTDERK